MDLNKFYRIKAVNHFAEELKVGDRCIATIRHDTKN